MGIWPNFTGTIPGWSPTKIVQMVLIGCESKSRGQTIFCTAIFKNLLVCNFKAQSFHISYITSSKGTLPKLFKLCPWGSLQMAPLWPLTFSSGERPRALWALLLNFFSFVWVIFSSSELKVLMVSYCDRPLSVVRRRASSVVRRA